MAEHTQETEMTPGGVALTFERWHAEFRALLEEHRRDIQARLERIEKELDRKSDKDTVELMVNGVREDLRRHSEDIKCLYVGMSTKVSAETMWKVAGLMLSLGGIIAGIVTFLLNLLVKH